MPAGLTIFNDSGTVQIDENWRNYGFVQKISVSITAYGTSPPNPAGYNGMPYELAVSGTEALLCACRASTLKPVKLHSYYDGSTWTYNWLMMPPTAATYAETVDFFIFDTMNGSYSNVGLEVFDASGTRVYHSDAPGMKVGGVLAGNTSFSGTSGHTYVPLIMLNPLIAVNVGLGNRLFSHGLRSIGSTIESSPTIQLGAFGATSAYDEPGLYAAIDVTGL